jgi:hypothetical protein
MALVPIWRRLPVTAQQLATCWQSSNDSQAALHKLNPGCVHYGSGVNTNQYYESWRTVSSLPDPDHHLS